MNIVKGKYYLWQGKKIEACQIYSYGVLGVWKTKENRVRSYVFSLYETGQWKELEE